MLPGYVKSRAELARWLASADIYVSGMADETFGVSIVEAQASGLPVVGVAAGAMIDRVTDSLGRLGPVGDAAAMAGNILSVWNGDRARDDRSGRAPAHSNSAGTAAWRRCSAASIPPLSRTAPSSFALRPPAQSLPPDGSTAHSPRHWNKDVMVKGRIRIDRSGSWRRVGFGNELGRRPRKRLLPRRPATQMRRRSSCCRTATPTSSRPTVHDVVDGQPQQSKVKLCGKEGQSDADWIGTLKDAVAKLGANKEMPAAVRDQIVTALKTEISRLEFQGAKTALSSHSAGGQDLALDGCSALPPLPQAKRAARASLPPPARQIAQAAPTTIMQHFRRSPRRPPAPSSRARRRCLHKRRYSCRGRR